MGASSRSAKGHAPERAEEILPAIFFSPAWSNCTPIISRRTTCRGPRCTGIRSRRSCPMTASSRPAASPPCSIRCGSGAKRAPSEVDGEAEVLAEAIATARHADLLRIDHFLHLRCEVPMPERRRGNPGVDRAAGRPAPLAHGPHAGATAVPRRTQAARLLPRQERRHDRRRARCAVRQARSSIRPRTPRPTIATSSSSPAATTRPLASHDDTTSDHVAEAIRDGVSIAEFPTTVETAQALHVAGVRVLMGAPNLVRGGSHAGNVATAELARAGALDVLSSDYVPASLLMAALCLPKSVPTIGLADGDPHGDQDPGRGGRIDRPRRNRGRQARRSHPRPRRGDVPAVRSVWRDGRRVA